MTDRLPMTRGRVLALLIGVPLALALIALTAIDEVAFAGIASYYVGLNLPVHGTAQFSVGSGDLTVGQAAGDRLLVRGKARYSLVRSTVHRSIAPSVTSVSTHCEFPFGICDFHLRASLPVGTRALISDGSGDLTLRGLRHRQRHERLGGHPRHRAGQRGRDRLGRLGGHHPGLHPGPQPGHHQRWFR